MLRDVYSVGAVASLKHTADSTSGISSSCSPYGGAGLGGIGRRGRENSRNEGFIARGSPTSFAGAGGCGRTHECAAMPYRELEDQIRHYGPARYLCGLSDSLWTPDFTTIHDFSQLLGAEGLRRLNEFVVRMAHAEGFVDPSLCVADTTAQEAPMSYPTEVGLIGTFFKRVTCLGKKSGRSVSPRLEKNRTQKPSAKPRVSRQALARDDRQRHPSDHHPSPITHHPSPIPHHPSRPESRALR